MERAQGCREGAGTGLRGSGPTAPVSNHPWSHAHPHTHVHTHRRLQALESALSALWGAEGTGRGEVKGPSFPLCYGSVDLKFLQGDIIGGKKHKEDSRNDKHCNSAPL